MSIEDFTMYDEWNQYRHALAEQPPVVAPRQVVLAGWGARFGAFVIDSILLSIPMMFFVWSEFKPLLETYVASASVDPATGQVDQTAFQQYMSGIMALNLKMTLVFVALATVYYVVCHGSMAQSLGKMLVGIRLIRKDGGDPTWGNAIRRALVNPIVQVVPVVGGFVMLLNGLWPLWDDNNQSLADKAGGTLVVRD
jgi:uncharacterized RDD family membrane protein YckC